MSVVDGTGGLGGSWLVLPVAYAYWHRKEQFLLASDVYPNWTMFAVEEGRFYYRIGEREGEAEFGDIVVCPPGIEFRRRTLSPLTFHFVQFVWGGEGAAASDERFVGKLSVSDRSRLLSTYAYLRQSGSHREDPDALGRFRHMLNDVWQLIEMDNGSALSENGGDRADPLMEKARRWLLERAGTPFAMRELSDGLGLTAVQFTRRFRAVYGMNPSEFVSARRLERACRLLQETKLTLDAIARQCGYENGFYLSRVFREKKGMAPSVYRKLHQV